VAAHSVHRLPLFTLFEGDLVALEFSKASLAAAEAFVSSSADPSKVDMVFVKRRGTAWFSAPQPSVGVYFGSLESLSDPITGR
jgi:hypothetical protein